MEHLYTNRKKTVIWERKRYILKENFSESTTWIQCFQISITMNHLVFIFEYLEQNGLKSDRLVSFRRSDETPWNSMISPMALCSSNNCDTPGNQPQDKLRLATRHESTHIHTCLPGKAIVVQLETLVKIEKHWTLIQISSIRNIRIRRKVIIS